jgi:signal transduction histidine kinase
MWRTRRLRELARHHARAVDLAVVSVIFLVTLFATATATGSSPRAAGLSASAVLVAGVSYGALLLRRRRPLLVLAVTVAGAEVYLALCRGELVLTAPLVALYAVAESGGGHRRPVAIGGLAVVALAGLHALQRPGSWLGPENLALAALGGLAVAIGDASRSHRAYVAEVEARARRAELDRQQEARRQVAEERIRIARDLHDMLGHHLALINVQAGVAAHVLDDQPRQTRQALAHIRQTCRAGLADLRDTVGLLRQPGDPAAPTEPTVGLAGLPGLIAGFTRSGLRIAEEVNGAVYPLPHTVDRTAYRIIQESLTNAGKHAGQTAVRLNLHYGRQELRIVVEDDGTGGRSPDGFDAAPRVRDGTGHGIMGMTERVAAVGGNLDAGPQPGGGYRVRATLPLHTDS